MLNSCPLYRKGVAREDLQGGFIIRDSLLEVSLSVSCKAITESFPAVGITKDGPGLMQLTGANIYTGATTVSGGTLSITNGSALGTTAAGTTVANGATLALSGGIAVGAEAVSITGVGVGGNGAIRNTAGSNSLAGAVTLAGSSTVRVDVSFPGRSAAGPTPSPRRAQAPSRSPARRAMLR